MAHRWDLAVLLEVTPQFWTALQQEVHGVYALDLVPVQDMQRPHGVALLARNGWSLSAPHAPPIPEGDLESRPRAERWLTATAHRDGEQVTLVGFHAPYAAGRDRAEKLRNRARKRRAYEALTAWVSARPRVVVGMDGNNWWDPVLHVAPIDDPEASDFWSENRFHGLGPLHGLVDTYRRWCTDQGGRLEQIATMRPDGPLAVTHDTGRDDGSGIFRMDRIYASSDLSVISADVDYEPALSAGSDHALVWAELEALVAPSATELAPRKNGRMAGFVGTDRAEALDYLTRCYDGIAAGNGPFVVTLEAPMGMGKTRVVQELYAVLAAGRQSGVPYWPPTVADINEHLLTARKRIAPERFLAPGGASLPWLWWAINCHVSHVGSPLQSLQTAAPQLEAHAEAIQSEVAKKSARREDAVLAVTAMFDLLGVVDPTAALDAAQKGWTLWRRRRDRRSKVKELRIDRIIDPAERSLQLALELTKSVRELSAAVPIVLVVDDAQWADPALVSLLRHTGELEGARLLIVCCVWPEALVMAKGTDTFASWLSLFETSRPDRLARFRLQPLAHQDLARLVLDAAPRTAPAVADSLVELASGNPLTLNLILDLDRVRRDVAEDGRIDLDPKSLAGLPRDVEALYQELWRQLPEASRRVLAALALQGPRFTVGWLDDFASGIGQYAEMTAAYEHVIALQSWIRPGRAPFDDFAELARHRVAFDNVQQLLSDEEQIGVYRAITSHLLGLWRDPSWVTVSADTKRAVLGQFLEFNERLGEGVTRDIRTVLTAIAELAELEIDALHADRAIELARNALRVAPADAELEGRIRRVLGNALVAAGRGAEAIPLLERAATEANDEQADSDLSEALEAAASESPAPNSEPLSNEITLEEWDAWEPRSIESLTALSASAVGELIADVVSAEGPVLFGRVTYLLRTAAGASRAGAAIRNALDRGLAAAVSAGAVVATAPDASGEAWRRTLRAPGQPTTLRVLGPRDTWDVPPEELEALARRILASSTDATRDDVKRRIASLYGWSRYTSQLDELLESVLPSDIGLPGSTTAASGGADPVRAIADAKGVADDYDLLLGVGARHGLDTRRWPSSTTLTPSGKRQYTLVYVGVRGSGIHVGYSTENFERFLGLKPEQVEGALGPNWRDLEPGTAGEYAARLGSLLEPLASALPE